MLTRRLIDRGVLWTGIGLGALGLLGYLLSPFVAIGIDKRDRVVEFGNGAFSAQWGIRYALPAPGGPPVIASARGWFAEAPGPFGWRWLPRCTDPNYSQAGKGPGVFAVPYWVPLGLGLLAAYVLLPAGAKPRDEPRCPSCRFDLGGAPPIEVRRVHVQCPECGTISEREEPTKPP
jgi:hypothetical protein